MGAARRLDPTRIKVADIWQTRGCRLGHFVRKRLRKRNKKAKFQCVYSDELMPLRNEFENSGEDQPNGSAAHITGIFGFHLCGLVIKDVIHPFKDIRPLS
jgi:tRNA A37 threonylcarbamoyladenosine dehydratase